MLLTASIRPILVFDGANLPAKSDTESKRRRLMITLVVIFVVPKKRTKKKLPSFFWKEIEKPLKNVSSDALM